MLLCYEYVPLPDRSWKTVKKKVTKHRLLIHSPNLKIQNLSFDGIGFTEWIMMLFKNFGFLVYEQVPGIANDVLWISNFNFHLWMKTNLKC